MFRVADMVMFEMVFTVSRWLQHAWATEFGNLPRAIAAQVLSMGDVYGLNEVLIALDGLVSAVDARVNDPDCGRDALNPCWPPATPATMWKAVEGTGGSCYQYTTRGDRYTITLCSDGTPEGSRVTVTVNRPAGTAFTVAIDGGHPQNRITVGQVPIRRDHIHMMVTAALLAQRAISVIYDDAWAWLPRGDELDELLRERGPWQGGREELVVDAATVAAIFADSSDNIVFTDSEESDDASH